MPTTSRERMAKMRYRQYILDTLGYGNIAPESKYDPDKIVDGRDDSKWVAHCLDILGKWAASVYAKRAWTPAGKRERENRGEVGFTG